jgi:tetratricopeptide (TPR) repeat protein
MAKLSLKLIRLDMPYSTYQRASASFFQNLIWPGLVLNNLGNCLRLEKKYAEAESALTRAKAILENPPHKSYPIVIDSFAGLRAAQGRYEEASQLYAECLRIHEGRPSSNLRELAETCERYAEVLYKLQKEKQADALMAKVTELRSAREKLLTPAV